MVERDEKGRAFQILECPRSATSDWAIELVFMVSQQLNAHEMTGAAMFPGPDISLWPQWWYEAVMAISQRRAMRQRAEIETASRE